jgi:hypothetical protein
MKRLPLTDIQINKSLKDLKGNLQFPSVGQPTDLNRQLKASRNKQDLRYQQMNKLNLNIPQLKFL